jgi:hypothetical protein
MQEYRWRTKAKGILTSRENINPTEVGKIIKLIADKKGKCTPRDVVEVARPVDSVLHPLFQWDDTKAAEAFRQQQARSLIRSIQVVRLEGDKPKIVERKALMVHVPTRDEDNQEEAGYITIESALNDKVARGKVVEMAFKQLQGIRAKYGDFNELDEIWGAIDRVAKWRGQPVVRPTQEDRQKSVGLHIAASM